MRKLLLNPTPLFRKLRQLSMLLTLLLVPLGALGQTITVAGISPDNQTGAIAGANITGTVSFDSQTNTLTLTNATINGNIAWTDAGNNPDLTIQMSGKNSVNGSIESTNQTKTCSLHIKKITDAESATLKYTGSITGFITDSETGFKQFDITDGNTTYHYYTTADVYELSFGTIQVHGIEGELGYKDNIFQNDGTPTATFDGTNKITLNGATLTSKIHWGADANLTIELKGTNSINTNETCITSEYRDKVLSFTAGGENCSLELSTGTATDESVITGFSTSMGTGLFWIPTWTNDVVTSATIKTILGGGAGTSGSPLIITSYDHLKDFATYVNNGILTTEHIKLGADIDCTGKTDFVPIGKDSNKPFQGTFDGDNKMIQGLSVTYSSGKNVGLIGCLDGGTITQLILDGCTIKGGSSKTDDNYIGGIVGYVSNNGTVSKCKVQNGSTISCNADSNSPIVGGIVGYLDDGTITECLFQGTSVNAVNTAVGAATSGSIADAGGVVGKASGTVSKCQVKGAAEISAIYSITSYTNTGAIIGEMSTVTLSNNTYDYSVITKVQSSDITELTTYSEYTQRGIGKDTYGTVSQTNNFDVTENKGAVMYTKIVSLPTENSAGTVEGVDGTYYKVDGTSLYVAPGQTAKIDATPNTANYALAWLQAVKTGTTDVVICDSTNIANGGRQYTFTMPDAGVTVNVSWDELYNLWIGDTQVTSANAAHILGESNTTVSFTSADPNLQTSANTLTLNGATLTVPVKVGLANLTIDIQGTNSITTDETCIQNTLNTVGTTPAVTFKSTSTEKGSLILKNTSGDLTGVNNIGVDHKGSFTISNELALVLKRYGDIYSNQYWFTDGSTLEAILSPSYGVTVGGMQICKDNASDIIGEGIEIGDGGKVSFNKETNTLTLNKADISGAISTSLAELTVELVGDNTIFAGDDPAFQSSSGNAVLISIQSTAEEKGNLTMNCNTGGSFFGNHVTLHIIEPLDVVSGSLTGSGTVIIGEDYKLTVAGTKVTYLNKDNVLGDGKISFTPSSNTLTLNGATINGNINYNGTTDFTIALNGSNSIENTNGNYAIVTNTTTTNSLKFEKATNASTAELTLKWASGDKAISANDSILGNGLYWKPIAATQMNITDNPEFVIVGDYAIPDGTTVNGTTSGTITYNATDKLLTISSFSETYDKDAIKTGVSGLKVKLVGESVVTCNGYDKRVFIAFATSASIQFVKNDASSKLTMSTSLDPLYGFAAEAITYDGLFYYNAGNNQYIIRPKSSPTIKFVERDQSNGNIPDDPKDYVYVSGTGAIQMPYVASYYAPKPVFSDDYQLSDSTRYEYTMSVDGMVQFALGGTTQGNPGKIDYADNGEISLLKAGTVTITCSFPGNMQNNPCSASYTLQVNKADANLAYNATTSNAYIDLSGNGQWGDPNGTGGTAPTLTKPTNVTGITYTSSNTNVATVSTAGVVTPKGAGSATITATIKDDERYNDATASYTLTVMVPATISFANATASIVNTETYTQTASTVPAGSTITYSSSNNDVNVNANGEVTISKSFYGKATITATVTAVPAADPQYYYVLPDNTAFQATYDLTVSKVFNSVTFVDGQNFATYYNGSENMTVPEGLTAYLITGTSGNSVVTYPINYLPQNVPLLLEKSGTAGSTLTNTIYSGTELTDAERGSNNLQYAEGNLGISDILGGTPYILYKNEFVKASGTIPQNHCYLLITNPAPTRGYYSIGHGNDGSTAIDDTLIDNEETTNDDWYDLQGRRIQKPTKAGIYIVNGKKMIVK